MFLCMRSCCHERSLDELGWTYAPGAMSGPPKPAGHAAMDEPPEEPPWTWLAAGEPSHWGSFWGDDPAIAEAAPASAASAAEPSDKLLLQAAASSQHDADPAIGEAAPASVASAAEPSDNLLLRRAELTGLRQTRSNRKRELHDIARDVLTTKIRAFTPHQDTVVQSQPVDTIEWPTWKEYVASHAKAETIVGTQGIKAINIEQIDGVKDPNRGGQRRVDIVVYNADGQFFRLHPGSKPSNDAALQTGNWNVFGASEPNAESSGAAEPGVADTQSIASASRQYQERPQVLTWELAEQIPQNHRIGRTAMFRKLQALPSEYPLELTNATLDVFPWWLWIPNIGTVRDEVIGSGIERIALVETTRNRRTDAITSAQFVIQRTDQTALLLSATDVQDGRRTPYRVQTLVEDSPGYNWWVSLNRVAAEHSV